MPGPYLRILHLCDVARPIVNGVVLAVEQLVAAQARAGHEIFTIAPALGGLKCGWNDTQTLYRLPSLPLPTRTGYRLLDPRAFNLFGEEWRGRYDLVHVHSLFAANLLAHRMLRADRRPCIITYHTRLAQYRHYAGAAAPLYTRMLGEFTRRATAWVDRVIAPTGAVADDLRRCGVGAPIRIAPSGIARENAMLVDASARAAFRRRFIARYHLPEDALIVLALGRIAREKNLGLLIRAWPHVQAPAMLCLAGGGPDQRRLEASARRCGVVERIRFLGAVTPAETPCLYAAADLFAFASRSESQGLVIAEALAAGLPIIAVDDPVTREILAGTDARLTADDAVVFAQAMNETLALLARQDPTTACELRARRNHAAQAFAADLCARRIDAIYREVLHERS